MDSIEDKPILLKQNSIFEKLKKRNMHNKHLVKKASGETEPFAQEKLEKSLRKAGVSEETVAYIVNDVKEWLHDGVSTHEIYARAFGLLKKKSGGTAAKYKLKKAMLELGPTGFPFEHFIGELMKQQGFEVKTGQIIQGICVQHEVDVVATNENVQRLVECKYHNSPDKISNVQVPLYIRSRMNDIIDRRKKNPEFDGLEFEGWVVTNTRFSSDAIDYGTCSGLKMLSWDFPENHALKDLIERFHLFPITTLVHLNQKQKVLLTEKGIVLCRQLLQQKQVLNELVLTNSARRKIIAELESLCNHA